MNEGAASLSLAFFEPQGGDFDLWGILIHIGSSARIRGGGASDWELTTASLDDDRTRVAEALLSATLPRPA